MHDPTCDRLPWPAGVRIILVLSLTLWLLIFGTTYLAMKWLSAPAEFPDWKEQACH